MVGGVLFLRGPSVLRSAVVEDEHVSVLVQIQNLLIEERNALVKHTKYKNATKIHAKVVYCDTF
jgi:hypothetical protein